MNEQLQPRQPAKRTAHEAWELEQVAALGVNDDLWDRMQDVEQIFKEAPVMVAPPEFADKVMMLIASRDFDQGNDQNSGQNSGSSPKSGSGNSGGMGGMRNRKLFFFMSAVFTVIASVLLTAWAAASPLTYQLAERVALRFNRLWQSVTGMWAQVVTVAPAGLALSILLVGAIAIISAWIYSVMLMSRRQQVVYHIPVQFE